MPPSNNRRFFVGGNWKMNGDKASIDALCKILTRGPLDPETEVVVAVPAVYLERVRGKLPWGSSGTGGGEYRVVPQDFTQ